MSKARLPKAYTDEQLIFLRNHISGFETRSCGHMRGDAKKFALDRANEFLVRFGMPEDLQDADEAEPIFREQIYNWYKNTTGRARRRLEGRTRSKKAAEQESPTGQNSIAQWSPDLTTPTTVPYAAQNIIVTQTASSCESPQQLYQRHVPPLQPTGHMQFSFQTAVTVPSASTLARNIDRNPNALRDAFLTRGISATTLSSLIQSYVLSHPSPTPLNPIIDALFAAVTSSSLNAPPASRTASTHDTIITILRRFTEACEYFPTTLVHAGVPGPLAGPRALQMAIRKSSVWCPISAPVSYEMERVAAERQRGKDHIQWAQIHGAALELGLLSFCNDYAADRTGDSLSELMARDAVWGADEVEWVAGISVLRSVIRTGLSVRKHVYEQLLSTYEGRWNEIEDEARQVFVTEVLLSAQQDLAHMDEGFAQ